MQDESILPNDPGYDAYIKDLNAVFDCDSVNGMMVVLVDGKVVGMPETYGTDRISIFFVDVEYQRKGIATAMMSKIASELKMQVS